MVVTALRVLRGPQEETDWLAGMDETAAMTSQLRGHPDQKGGLDHRGQWDPGVGGWCTPGGGGTHAQQSPEQAWCTLAGLEGLGGETLEAVPTICACLKSQSMAATNREYKVTIQYMGPNIKPTISFHSAPQLTIIMHPVLSAMLPLEKQY